MTLSLPTIAEQIEQLKIDLAFYENQAETQCMSLESGLSANPLTSVNGRSLTSDNCADVAFGLLGRVVESNPDYLEGHDLEEVRARTTSVVNHTPDYSFSIPSVSEEALACCDAGVGASLYSLHDYEQCVNDVEDFDLYLS